jgi:hypothetical protein
MIGSTLQHLRSGTTKGVEDVGDVEISRGASQDDSHISSRIPWNRANTVTVYTRLSTTLQDFSFPRAMQNKISSRGLTLESRKPVFFDVLNNLWDPESNPDGIINIGLAENVGQPRHDMIDRVPNKRPGIDAS